MKITKIQRKNGSVYCVTIGTGKDRIRKIFKTYIEAVASVAKHTKLPTANAFTIGKAMHFYLLKKNYSKTTYANVHLIGKIIDTDIALEDINNELIDNFIDKLRRTRAEASLRPVVSTFNKILKVASNHGLMDRQLVHSLYFPPMKAPRVRRAYFTEEVFQRMLTFCDTVTSLKVFKEVLLFLYDTGTRWVSEMLRLKCKHVKDGLIYIPAEISKTKQSRRITMSPEIYILTRDRKTHRNAEDFLFDDFSRSIVNRKWAKVRKHILPYFEADFEARDCVLHTLRHTFMTRLGDAGVSASLIAQQAGHNLIQVTALYTKQTNKPNPLIIEALSKSK